MGIPSIVIKGGYTKYCKKRWVYQVLEEMEGITSIGRNGGYTKYCNKRWVYQVLEEMEGITSIVIKGGYAKYMILSAESDSQGSKTYRNQ